MFSADNMVNYMLADEDPVAVKKAVDALKNREVFIIGFSGKKGSGKDTMAEIFEKNFTAEYGPASFSPFGDALKGEASTIIGFVRSHYLIPAKNRPEEAVMLSRMAEIFNLSIEQAVLLRDTILPDITSTNKLVDGWTRTPAVWKVLQHLGTDIRQPQDKIYWVRRSVHNIIVNANNGISTIVQDTRFLHEVEALKNMGGYVARVDVDQDVQLRRLASRDNVKATREALLHASEVELDDYPNFDIRVDNSLDGGHVLAGEKIYADWAEKVK